MNPMIETLKPAVERYNAAKPGMQVYDAKDEIDKVLRNTVRKAHPKGQHLGLFQDPHAAMKLDACVTSRFASEGSGGAYVGESLRNSQFARVQMSLLILSGDIRDAQKKPEGRGYGKHDPKEHERVKNAILDDLSNLIIGPRATDKDLSAKEIKDNRFRELSHLLDKFTGASKLDPGLFRDMIVRCAKDMGLSTESDFRILTSLIPTDYKGTAVFEALDKL